MKVDFYKHNLNKADQDEAMKVLSSIFLTTWSLVADFERKLASFTSNSYAVWIKSCTAWLFLALKYYNIGEWDEVITTPLSFVATANSIEHTWATPVFVDVESKTWNIDVSKIEEKITSKTKAIIPVHLYGQMVDMKALRTLADLYNIKIIEDCAHCIEGERDWIKPWNLWDIACFSFYATKNITSWEWWAITTNDEEVYKWMKKARSHGLSSNAADRYTKYYTHYDMEFLWYKENMTNIDASLLIHQIDRINDFLIKKEYIAWEYDQVFQKLNGIKIPQVVRWTKHARHLYTIQVDSEKRDIYLSAIQEKWVWIAVNFRPIHLMSYYKRKYKYTPWDFPVAEEIWASTISIPLYPKLTKSEIEYIINTIIHILKDI